jgi:hypothetical protein
MEPEGSLQRSQQLATGRSPEPYESSPHLAPNFPKIHLNIILPSTPRFPDWSLPSRLTNQNFVCISRQQI